MNNFWDNLQNFIGYNIPNKIIEILTASGYDNAISLAEINVEEIKDIEIYVNQQLPDVLKNWNAFSSSDSFTFLPGHKKLLLKLAQKAAEYMRHKKTQKNVIDLSNFTTIMKELINAMHENSKVCPTRHRYSETIRSFATYIYIISGKAAYEVLSNNLPLPQASTISKFEFIIRCYSKRSFHNS